MTSRQFSHTLSHANNRASSHAQSQPFEQSSPRYHSLPSTPQITTTIVLDPHLHPSLRVSAPMRETQLRTQTHVPSEASSPDVRWSQSLHPTSPTPTLSAQALSDNMFQSSQLSRTSSWPASHDHLQVPGGLSRERSMSQPPSANEPISPMPFGGQRKRRSTSNLGPRPEGSDISFSMSNA